MFNKRSILNNLQYSDGVYLIIGDVHEVCEVAMNIGLSVGHTDDGRYMLFTGEGNSVFIGATSIQCARLYRREQYDGAIAINNGTASLGFIKAIVKPNHPTIIINDDVDEWDTRKDKPCSPN